MADSKTPLLTKYGCSNPKPDESLEEIIEPYLRGLTRRQFLNVMLGFLPSVFAAQLTFVSIFTDATPTWHCTLPRKNTTCKADSNICELPQSAWSWDKPAQTSIISEWFLDCATNSIIQGLPASSFFMGSLIAGFGLFFIGDSFGRKKMLFVSCVIMSAASLFTAFANNVWIYSAMRFMSGAGRAAIGTCALVLATESVERKWQSKIGSVGFVVFTTGFLLLPGIAYSVRNYSWRFVYFLISVPGIIFTILLQLFGYESPKWLLAKGRQHEAIQVLKALAGSNSRDLSWDFPEISANQDHSSKGNQKLSFFRILMESRALTIRFFLLLTIAFGIGLVYYGTSLGVGSLGLNIYWGAEFNAMLQVLSFVVVYLTVTKLKRRVSILAFTLISGVGCILLCTSLSKVQELEMAFELLAFFSASTSFSLSLIYTAELFPTCGRNSAVAMVWQALMLGGVVSPVLAAAAGSNNILSYGTFGVLSIATGSLVLILPETVGVKNPADGKEQDDKQGSGV